jgi:hypothetical protein
MTIALFKRSAKLEQDALDKTESIALEEETPSKHILSHSKLPKLLS